MINREFSAGGVICRKEKGYFLFLLIYSNRNKIWGFPKGHIEPQENEREAACREIREETGLRELSMIEGFCEEAVYEAKSSRGQWKGQTIEKHSIYFLFKTGQEHIRVDNHEITDYKWLAFDGALALLKFENERNILQSADRYLKEDV